MNDSLWIEAAEATQGLVHKGVVAPREMGSFFQGVLFSSYEDFAKESLDNERLERAPGLDCPR